MPPPTTSGSPLDGSNRAHQLVVTGGRVLSGGPVLGEAGADVVCLDGRIATVSVGPVARGDAVLDASGLVVAPGLIDLQINGGYGIDLVADPASLWKLGARLPATGVTAFLPTIVSSPLDRVDAAMEALAVRPEGYRGAEPLGLHLEGPFLASARRGAHRVEHLQPVTAETMARWSRSTGVALVTLAPELPGALAAVAELRDRGVVVAGGHTEADATVAAAATEAGMTLVTHLFNAMTPMGHRNPNLAGYVLGSDRLAAGLIVDGVHVDPLVVAAAWRALGPDRTVLVTDAVAAMGLAPGNHTLGRTTVHSDGTAVRTLDGTLAGSALTLDQAVQNLRAATGATLAEAVTAAATTPAVVLGDRMRGLIRPGRRADLAVMDGEGGLVATICGGDVEYLADDQAHRLRRRH